MMATTSTSWLSLRCPQCAATIPVRLQTGEPSALEIKAGSAPATSMDRLGFAFEVKAVDVSQRIIEGYAAVTGNTDRVGDIIAPGAFGKTLREKKPADVGVFLAHNTSTLPLGVPLSMQEDSKGLYTRTRVFRTQAGDDLLQTALELQAVGKTLGMSIGFYVRDFSYEKSKDGSSSGMQSMVRLIKDIDLVEYSYAAAQTIANPEALVTGVKQQQQEQEQEQNDDAHFLSDSELKAEWTAAYINDLPDSAFAVIEAGGSKDDEGKTVPRSLRHFPHHNAEGAIDLPHLRNSLARAPQSPLGDRALPHLQRHANAEGIGDGGDGKTAATRDDGEIKAGRRMRGQYRQHLAELAEILGKLRAWADYDDLDAEDQDNAEDGKQAVGAESETKRQSKAADTDTVDAYADQTESDSERQRAAELEAYLVSLEEVVKEAMNRA